jgi:hypothetical protein
MVFQENSILMVLININLFERGLSWQLQAEVLQVVVRAAVRFRALNIPARQQQHGRQAVAGKLSTQWFSKFYQGAFRPLFYFLCQFVPVE